MATFALVLSDAELDAVTSALLFAQSRDSFYRPDLEESVALDMVLERIGCAQPAEAE